jgi:hypothetical protein
MDRIRLAAELVECAQTGKAGAHLTDAALAMGRANLESAAEVLVTWLAGRASQDRPWKLRLHEPPGKYPHVERLLAECAAMSLLFHVIDGRVDFADDIPTGERRSIEMFARTHFKPVVEH